MNSAKTNDFTWYNTYTHRVDVGQAMRDRPPVRSEKAFRRASLALICRRLWSGLRKVVVAYRQRLEYGAVGEVELFRWLKILLVAAILGLLLLKNVSFHVRRDASVLPPEGASGLVQTHTAAIVHAEWAEHGAASFSAALSAEEEAPRDFFAELPTDDPTTRQAKAYIRRFRKVARTEMQKFGIPASVKMAQALVESRAGSSRLARENNNHFGIKCFSKSCKKGHCSNFSDDHHKDFFRIYASAWESWRAHSLMLTQGRYRKLLAYGKDYRKWAKGLKDLGYATAPNYAQTLIQTIEQYELWRLDADK